MRLRLLLSVSLLLGIPAAFADSADDYFHGGAQSYITNNVPKAREFVDQGLKLYPDDIKLKKLDELLKQQQQQSQSQSQSQDQQQQQQQSGKSDEKPEQSKQDQQQQQKQPRQNEEQTKEEASGRQAKENEKEPPGQMTPQQAKQLLDAQKNGEALLPYGRKDQKRTHPERVLRDW